jgi:ribosome modulation factor
MTAPTLPTAVTKAAHALLGLTHTLAARVLPWSGRSQQDCWLEGYRAAMEDVVRMRRNDRVS